MNGLAQLREELRPHGMLAHTCPRCVYFEGCGGIEPDRALLDCFELSFCKQNGNRQDCSSCSIVCPYSGSFHSRLQEVGGLYFGDLRQIKQPQLELPHYIPVIDHASRRSRPLQWPVVALDTYKVLRLKNGRYETFQKNGDGLRQALQLSSETKILLRGVAKDPALERYWSYRRRDDAPGQIASLDISLAIGPNFSHFLDVPRTDNLFNRKRQLICLAELSSAGVAVAPHLSAVSSGDLRFWRSYLLRNETITYVAREFQTGNKKRSEGQKAIDQMARIRDAIGRPLHPLIIGAGQFVEYVATKFDRFSLIDSEPFMKAVHRRRFDRDVRGRPWRETYTLEDQRIDDIVLDNLTEYAAWIDERIASATTHAIAKHVPRKPR